jgi:oligopeptidase A
MSEDAFDAFQEAGLNENGVTDDVKAVGQRFRETVLGLGGSQPASDVFRAFRGREPAPKALLNRYFGE